MRAADWRASESCVTDRDASPSTSSADAVAWGRAQRARVGRSAHGHLDVGDRDPVAILEDQHTTRLQGLVPVRIGRMLQSPFAYYRGTAAVMAHDLAAAPVIGHDVVACGDAHISNFGLFASPERRVLFDLNDFDEAMVAPWEWDVKRLAGSVHVGARDLGLDEATAGDATRAAVRAYRNAIRMLAQRTALERLSFQVGTDWLERVVSGDALDVMAKAVRRATKRTSEQALQKIATTTEDGTMRIVDQPPVMMHVGHATSEDAHALLASYQETVRADTAVLLSQFEFVDVALRVVGVGSVGTRCYVLLLQGPSGEPLVLQAKEAPPSVLETYGGLRHRPPAGVGSVSVGVQGHRVVTSQRILQAQSDPFLGWITGYRGESARRVPADFYWRQFRDMKGSVEVSSLTASQFEQYGRLCAGLLARAHSQSPRVGAIAGYLGSSERFDGAVAEWARSYADQIERDFAAVERAAAHGRLPVERGT